MIFTTFDFLIFFFITFSLYWLARRQAWQNLVLLTASYVFYGWVNPRVAVLLGISTLADYFLALNIANRRERANWAVAASLLMNLGVLGFFKYYNFFSTDLVHALAGLGIRADGLLVTILLPAGLSFYTLKKLAYILDVWRGGLQPTRNLIGFALFVSFFPQITAGPIDRAQKLMPQIHADRTWKAEYLYSAWPLIVMGFFKKIVIADSLHTMTQRIYALEHPALLLALSAALAFSLEILADFSAYSDISRGIALLFGFETSVNFNAPYLALTPTEFWNRWHITLSTWLRDYMFFPLRRSLTRSSMPRWAVNMLPPLLTMLVSGLWHGAGWTFLVWGGLWGLLIVVYQALGLGGQWTPANWLTRSFAQLAMFTFLLFSWLIFRAPSLGWVGDLFTTAPWAGSLEEQTIALICLSMTIFYALPLLVKHLLDRRYTDPNSVLHSAYYAIASIAIIIHFNSTAPDFIYFQF